jgi:NAD+ synthase (glutamine-hydrolysing)
MKIGLAQINITVGDLVGNSKKIVDAYDRLCKEGADLVIFPELTLPGYSPGDLLFKSHFVADNEKAMRAIADRIGDKPALIGYVQSIVRAGKTLLFNAAAWCHNGKIDTVAHKCLLPSYNIFNEKRYFQPGKAPSYIDYLGKRIGITICEDIWNRSEIPSDAYYELDPVEELRQHSVDVILNLSASPWHHKKRPVRKQVLASVAIRCNAPLVYCNMIGGNDEIVFDGHSQVIAADGTRIAGLAGFREDFQVIEIETTTPAISPYFDQDDMQDIHDALVLGLHDYATKTGFKKVLIGLSGGIDSAVTAALAVKALGAKNVIGVRLPSAHSSQHSLEDAAALAENLGLPPVHTLEIQPLVEAAENALEPVFEGLPRDITEENIQARARGMLLMAISNKLHALLLSTGNKSEMAVGYCTLYGDMAGGLALLSDVLKTEVYKLAHFINKERAVIPSSTLEKPPSAELRPDQKDQDSLPPYPVLDAIIDQYIVEGKSSQEIIDAGYDETIVRESVRKIDCNEYKRKQAAPGIRITPTAFGIGRRIPIVQKYIS